MISQYRELFASPYNRPAPPIVAAQWCLSSANVFHLTTGRAKEEFSGGVFSHMIVNTVCGGNLIFPDLLITMTEPVREGLAKLLIEDRQVRMCARCSKSYPAESAALQVFLKTLETTVSDDHNQKEEQSFQRQQTMSFRVEMDSVIEMGIAESIDTPLKDLNLGNLTIRDLLTAFDGMRFYHLDLVKHADYYAKESKNGRPGNF